MGITQLWIIKTWNLFGFLFPTGQKWLSFSESLIFSTPLFGNELKINKKLPKKKIIVFYFFLLTKIRDVVNSKHTEKLSQTRVRLSLGFWYGQSSLASSFCSLSSALLFLLRNFLLRLWKLLLKRTVILWNPNRFSRPCHRPVAAANASPAIMLLVLTLTTTDPTVIWAVSIVGTSIIRLRTHAIRYQTATFRCRCHRRTWISYAELWLLRPRAS